MERHLSTGVATIVALLAERRTTSALSGIPFELMEDADFGADHTTPRDKVGDWILTLANQRALVAKKAANER
jgi:hypothetical protein